MTKEKKFSVRPLADRVVVRPAKAGAEKKLPSGIIIPETVDKEKPMEGDVVAVGSGKFEDGKVVPMSVKVGDRVLFGKYSHEEVKVGGEEYYILSESNILAVLN